MMTVLEGPIIYVGKVALAILLIHIADRLYDATKDKGGHEAPPWIRNLMMCELLAQIIGAPPVLTALFLIPLFQLLKKLTRRGG